MKNLKNNDVLDWFLRGVDAENSGKNLYSMKHKLYNYSTEIARLYGRYVLVNGHKYSSTTSKHQNYLMRNSNALVVNKDMYEYLVETLDHMTIYDLVEASFKLTEESCIDMTSTKKKDKELIDKIEAILYIHRK